MPASNERLPALDRSSSPSLTTRRRRVQVLTTSALIGLVGGIVFVACSTTPTARPGTGSGAGGSSGIGTGRIGTGSGGANGTIGGMGEDDAGNAPLTSCDSN